MNTEDDDSGFGEFLADALGGLNAIHAGHSDVHNDYVGGYRGRRLRPLPVAGFCNDGEFGFAFKNQRGGADGDEQRSDERSIYPWRLQASNWHPPLTGYF